MTVGTGTFSRRAKRWTIVIVVAALLASAGGWWALKQGRPWLYGLEAYMYGFPLVMMDLTKEAATAVPSAGEITAPINQFAVMTKYPDASFRAVVRTGLDTLFATAWADLDKEPLVLSVPDTNAAVDALQKQYKLTPLSAWGKPYEPSAEVPVAAGADAKALPLVAVSKMDAGTFFGRVARLMKDNPPAPADAPMVAKLKVLGIEPGKDFDIEKIDPDTARGLRRAMGAFEKLQEGVKKLKTNNGWIVIPKDFADYGTDYETRAGIALIGLGGIWRQDVVYPTAFLDGDDKPLDGANGYVLHFDKGQTPPNNATWSVSMYDPDGYYVPNAINRYNLAAWMPLKRNADGSLDMFIQANTPGAHKEANWLPAPARGPFSLTVRIYWPTETVLDNTYKLPPVRKIQ